MDGCLVLLASRDAAMKLHGVPVVMYHGVGPLRPGWIWSHLVTPVDVFEAQMRVLAESGWRTISLSMLHSHLSENAALPEKSVVLTFDDGYLDNWVYAYPILKKYGHRAAIWISTDFADPAAEPRPTLDDVWEGRTAREELPESGYLSWGEMRRMVEGGRIEIQSHAKTHTWYFSGPEVVDFHRPEGVDGYVFPPWLAWNLFPGRKHESLSVDLSREIPYGTPIYRHGKSLVTRRYFENAGLTGGLTERVAAGGGEDFFRGKGWRNELRTIANAYPSGSGRFETEQEYMERVRGELAGSRSLIEERLGTKVEFLCWPGGEYTTAALGAARDAGYLATTTHFEDPVRRNVFGQDPREINRIGCGAPWMWRGKTAVYRTDPDFFVTSLEMFAGDAKRIWRLRFYKLNYLLRYYFFGTR